QFHFPSATYASIAYRATAQGLRLTYNYDGSQHVESIVEPAARRVTLGYSSGRGQYVQDWADRRNTLAYNAGGELSEVTGPTGCITQFGHNSDHRITSILDPEGYETTYTYEVEGRVLTRSVAGNLGQYTYSRDVDQNLSNRYADTLGRLWTYLTSASG